MKAGFVSGEGLQFSLRAEDQLAAKELGIEIRSPEDLEDVQAVVRAREKLKSARSRLARAQEHFATWERRTARLELLYKARYLGRQEGKK